MSQTIHRPDVLNRLTGAAIRPILAPVWLGSERPGVELGPAEISHRLTGARLLPPIEIPTHAPADARTRLHRGDLSFLNEILEANEAIATVVQTTIAAGELAVTIGGDHSIALGTLVGAAKACDRLGVLWFDAHLDMNTPETSPTGHLHGMPLAASLGFGPAALTEIGGFSPKLSPSDLVVLGHRDIDAGEVALVALESIWTRSMDAWRADGILAALDCALERLSDPGIDAIHVSFDVDVLDPTIMPGTGTPVPNGLSVAEAMLVVERLREWNGPIHSVDFVELNPLLDPSGKSARNAVSLLSALLDLFMLPLAV
jgi:arginase